MIPLRAYWFTRRKPGIDIVAGDIVLVLPAYFGKRKWAIPASSVAVADLVSDPFDDNAVIPDGLAIPYLFTTGPLTTPTTLLLFREPQRVPPLRAVVAVAPNAKLPFGYRDSRSAKGAFVDGVLLRAEDPAEAAARLEGAGVARVGNP